MPSAKRRSATDARQVRDLRDHFAELCNGDVALTRHVPTNTLETLARNQDAWHVYVAIARAIRRGSKADLTLLRKLRSQFDHADAARERRRARFCAVVEAAISAMRNATSAAERQDAIMQVAAVIEVEVERDRAPGSDEDPWYDVDAENHSNWPLKQIEALLVKAKVPDASRARDKRGGRATYGVTQVAADLSCHFRLFGDEPKRSPKKLGPDVAKKFKTALTRTNRASGERKGSSR
jgi:hypothetical protein